MAQVVTAFFYNLRSRKKEVLADVDEITSHHRTTLHSLIAEAGASLPQLPEPKIDKPVELSVPGLKSKVGKGGKDVEVTSFVEADSKAVNKRKQQPAPSVKAPILSPIAPATKRTRGANVKATISSMVISEAPSPPKAKGPEPEPKSFSPPGKGSPFPVLKAKRGNKETQGEASKPETSASSPLKSKQRAAKKVKEAPAAKLKGGSRKRLAVASPEKVEVASQPQVEEEAVTGFVASPAFIAPAPLTEMAPVVESESLPAESTQMLVSPRIPQPSEVKADSKAKSVTPIKSSRKKAKIQKREHDSGSKTNLPANKTSSPSRNPFASPLAASVKAQPPPPSPYPLAQEPLEPAESNQVPSSLQRQRATPRKKTPSPSPLKPAHEPAPAQLAEAPQDAPTNVEAIEVAFSFAPVPIVPSPTQAANETQALVPQVSPGRKASGVTEQQAVKQRPKALRVPVVAMPPADNSAIEAKEDISLKADLLSPPLPVAALPPLVTSPLLGAESEVKELLPFPPSLSKGIHNEIEAALPLLATAQEDAVAVVPTAAAAPAPAPPSTAGGNLVGAIRSFLPQKKAVSPQIAAGKKPVKVKALEIAQAAKKAEEARLALQSAAALSSIVPLAIAGGGQVKEKAAAFQQRIEASQKSNVAPSAPQPPVKQPTLSTNVRAQPFGSFFAPKPATNSGLSSSSQGTSSLTLATASALTAEEKQRRAELRRKEEEDRKRAEVEAKGQKLKDRMKVHLTAAASKSIAPAPAPPPKPAPPASQAPLQPSSKSVNQASSVALAPPPPLSAKKVPKVGVDQPQAAQVEKTTMMFSFVKPVPPTKGTPNATKTMVDKAQYPPLTPADLRNIQKLVTSPYVTRAPASVKKAVNYEISPYRPNADEEDEDEWAEQSRKKQIPEWALPVNLAPALVSQNKMDPDGIFNWKQKTCPLEEIFEGMPPLPAPTDPAKAKKPKRDWRKRGSSGDWLRDRLTWQEDLDYRRTMQFV